MSASAAVKNDAAQEPKVLDISITATKARRAKAGASEDTPAPGVRGPSFPDSAKIVVLTDHNPKRPGTIAARKFDLYKVALADAKRHRRDLTVGDYVAAVLGASMPRRKAMSNLRWDTAHGFIRIDAA
jgi:hypothetical protein